MKFEKVVKLPRKRIDLFNSLLDIEPKDDGVIDSGYPEDSTIDGVEVVFDDGHFATVDICSGQSNFFCNPVLFNKNGVEVCVLDCADTFDGEYPFEDNGDIYNVIIMPE